MIIPKNWTQRIKRKKIMNINPTTSTFRTLSADCPTKFSSLFPYCNKMISKFTKSTKDKHSLVGKNLFETFQFYSNEQRQLMTYICKIIFFDSLSNTVICTFLYLSIRSIKINMVSYPSTCYGTTYVPKITMWSNL